VFLGHMKAKYVAFKRRTVIRALRNHGEVETLSLQNAIRADICDLICAIAMLDGSPFRRESTASRRPLILYSAA